MEVEKEGRERQRKWKEGRKERGKKEIEKKGG